MPTQTLSNAVVDPQDPGTGITDYDPNAAAIQALARSHEQGEYVGDGLQFANADTTNDQVDLTAGYCYILDDSASTAGSRSSGGQPQTMSTASTGYDTEIPSQIPYVVVVPSDVVDVSLEAGVNDVYISVDPSAQNAVTLHYGTTISAPTDPSLYLGTVDTSNGSTTSGDSGQSFDAETISAGEINNLIRVTSESDLTGLLAGEHGYIPPNETVPITSRWKPDSDTTLDIYGTLKQANGADFNASIISGGLESNITIRVFGEIDGNYANQTADASALWVSYNDGNTEPTNNSIVGPGTIRGMQGTGIVQPNGSRGLTLRGFDVRDWKANSDAEKFVLTSAGNDTVDDLVVDGVDWYGSTFDTSAGLGDLLVLGDSGGTSKRSVVKNNRMYDTPRRNIMGAYKAENNFMWKPANHGGGGDAISYTKQVLNNTLIGTYSGSTGDNGIIVSNQEGCVVDGNWVEGFTNNGISITDLADSIKGVTIGNNVSINNNQGGGSPSGNGLWVREPTGDGITDINIVGPLVLADNQSTPTQNYGLLVDTGLKGNNIKVQNEPVTFGNALGGTDYGDIHHIDYSDPFWFAKMNYNWWLFTATDPSSWQTFPGNGSISLNASNGGIRFDTGSTTGDTTYATKQSAFQRGTFDSRAYIRPKTFHTSNSDVTAYVTVGEVSQGTQGYGVKLDGGSWYAVVHDGTSETLSSAITSAGTYNINTWIFDYRPDDGTLTVDDGLGSSASVSSGLPSGFSGAVRGVHVYIETAADATKSIELQKSKGVREV